jgi:predicted MPP superfamily phosphohydrolase
VKWKTVGFLKKYHVKINSIWNNYENLNFVANKGFQSNQQKQLFAIVDVHYNYHAQLVIMDLMEIKEIVASIMNTI